MTLHKTQMQRKGRSRKQEQKFFVTLGILTILLIIVLYLIYS